MTVKTQKSQKFGGGVLSPPIPDKRRLWGQGSAGECVTHSGLSTIADLSHAMASRDIATSLGSTSMLPLSRRRAKKKKEEEEAPQR